MGLTRRSFLAGAVPVVAGVVVAIEETTRRIFLPPRGGWTWRDVSEPIINESVVTYWKGEDGIFRRLVSARNIGDMRCRLDGAKSYPMEIWNGYRWES